MHSKDHLLIKYTLWAGLILMTITLRSRTDEASQNYKLIDDHLSVSDDVLIPYRKYQLNNQLTVLLTPDHSDPLVHVEMTYHVGSAREELGRSGFAHLFEHMMFQGSAHVGDNEHFKMITEAGGTMNGATNRDMTYYYETLPKNHLEMALWLEADRMGFLLPALTEKKFENQRLVVKNERAQRVDNRPYGRVSELISQALYPENHPYSWPVIGWLQDLDSAQLEDVRQFFAYWYGPHNATLTIGGDFDEQQVMAWVEQYFGQIPRGPALPEINKTPITLPQDRYLTLEDKVHAPSLNIRLPTVYAYHEDEAALDILAKILGDGKNSLLYQNLVKTEDVLQVGSNHICHEQACEFSFFILTNPQKETDLKKTEHKVRHVIDMFEQRGVTDHDLQKIKSQIEVSRVHQLTSVASKVSILSNYEVLLGQPNFMKQEMLRYSQVTKQDVMDVYHRYIKNQPMVVMSVVPHGAKHLAAGQDFQAPQPPVRQKSGLEFQGAEMPLDTFDRSITPRAGSKPVVQEPSFWRHQISEHIDVIATLFDAPMTEMTIKIPGGVNLESPEKAGVARLTALMLHESTQKRTSEQAIEALEVMGSTVRFGVTMHDAYLHISTLTKHFDATLEIAREMLFQPALLEEDFARLKTKTIAALHQRPLNIQMVTKDYFSTLLFGTSHRYQYPIMGTLETVESLTLDDVKAFYQQQYHFEKAKVVALCDIPQDILLSKLMWLKDRAVQQVTPQQNLHFQSQTPGVIYFVDMPQAQQSVIRIGRLAKPFDIDGDYFKANLANYPFGGFFNSRINLNLREDKGYTYGINSAFTGDLEFGVFNLITDVQVDVTAQALEQIIAEMQRYQQQGMTEEELTFMRTSLLQQQALSYETPSQKMNFLAEIQRFGLTRDFPKLQDDLLSKIDRKTLNQVISAEFNLEQMIILVVGPKEYVLPQLIKLNLPLVELP